MPAGTQYTYVGNSESRNKTGAIQTSQGLVFKGQSGFFLPNEYAAAVGQGLLLTLGSSGQPAASPSTPPYATVGNDGYVGTPGQGGSPISPSAGFGNSKAQVNSTEPHWNFTPTGTTHTPIADFSAGFVSQTFGGVVETSWYFGYNRSGLTPSHQSLYFGILPDCGDVNGSEGQLVYTSPAGNSCFAFQFTGKNDGTETGNWLIGLPQGGGAITLGAKSSVDGTIAPYIGMSGLVANPPNAASASVTVGQSGLPVQFQVWGTSRFKQAVTIQGTPGVTASANFTVDSTSPTGQAFFQINTPAGQASIISFADATIGESYRLFHSAGSFFVKDQANAITVIAIANGFGAGALTLGAAGKKIGFYATTPVVQAARAGQLTDSTGGTVTSTLAAGITDAVAKNAIASLAAKVNAIDTIIHNLGLSA